MVNRKNPASRQESFNNMKKALADSFSVFIAYFSPPIETTDLTLDDIPASKEKVRQMMLSHLEWH